jgi:hypothetical protein
VEFEEKGLSYAASKELMKAIKAPGITRAFYSWKRIEPLITPRVSPGGNALSCTAE